MNDAPGAAGRTGGTSAHRRSLRDYFEAYRRGLRVISRGEQGPRLGCTGLLFAGLFLGMGWIFSLFTGSRIELACSRESAGPVDCRIQSRWYGLVVLNERQVENLQTATLDVHCDEEDCSYRVLLITAQAAIPLTDYFSAQPEPKETAIRAIAGFLDDPQAERLALTVGKVEEVGIANLLAPILILLGLVSGYFSVQSLRPRSAPA